MDANLSAAARPSVQVAAEGAPQPGLAVYLAAAVVTMALTAAELLLASSGGPRALLVLLALVNFAVGALFYQGLWHDAAVYKGIFAGGLFFGLLTFFSLVALLGLGYSAR